MMCEVCCTGNIVMPEFERSFCFSFKPLKIRFFTNSLQENLNGDREMHICVLSEYTLLMPPFPSSLSNLYRSRKKPRCFPLRSCFRCQVVISLASRNAFVTSSLIGASRLSKEATTASTFDASARPLFRRRLTNVLIVVTDWLIGVRI